jgi:hypothetical protein
MPVLRQVCMLIVLVSLLVTGRAASEPTAPSVPGYRHPDRDGDSRCSTTAHCHTRTAHGDADIGPPAPYTYAHSGSHEAKGNAARLLAHPGMAHLHTRGTGDGLGAVAGYVRVLAGL